MRYEIDPSCWLQVLRLRHAKELFDLVEVNRDHLRPWLPWVDQTTEIAVVEDFIRDGLQRFAEGRGFELGLWCEGRIAGVLGVHGADNPNRSATIGYWLDRRAQGRGLMTKACDAVVSHLFDDLDLHRVEIRCAVDNVRSQAIPLRLGFVQEGILRQAERHHDRFLDLVVFGLLADEWRVSDTSAGPIDRDDVDPDRWKEIVCRWMTEGWQRGNVEIIDQLHAADFVDHDPAGRSPDNEGFKEGIAALYTAFPDFKAKIEELVVDPAARIVTVRWSAVGTQEGEYLEAPASGKKIQFKGIEMVRIRGGRIAERWGEWDGMDLLSQLGRVRS